VPQVHAFSTSRSNRIGFEYILEDFMPGVQLSTCWNKLSFAQLSGVIRELATFQAQLFQHRFPAVGGLRKAANEDFTLGNMADIQFFWYERIQDKVHKGPFHSTHGWINTLLLLKLNESRRLYEEDMAGSESDRKPGQSCLLTRKKRLVISSRSSITSNTCCSTSQGY